MLIHLPIVENLREWFLNQKIERERKRILKFEEGKVRSKRHTEVELEQEMRSFLMRGNYIDSDGKERKIEKLSRDMASYYKE